jgi:hypothetical protein
VSVYLIGARQGGPVKIGFSGSPTGRLTALQTGSPFELVVLAQFSGGETEEKQLHELFAAERLRGVLDSKHLMALSSGTPRPRARLCVL